MSTQLSAKELGQLKRSAALERRRLEEKVIKAAKDWAVNDKGFIRIALRLAASNKRAELMRSRGKG